MALPNIILNIDNSMYGFPDEGTLVYQYSPFRNLLNKDPESGMPDTDGPALKNLTLDAHKAGINITEPITIETEASYDDSVNLIITDQKNPLKIVNSRFYQTSTTTYEVSDRRGNLDTNIYSEDNFQVEAGLVKSVRTITTIDFLGIKDGGAMKIGNYTFYFKLADADGNESDFIAESGKVVCHIGSIDSPKSIRGGQLDENSYKLIKFKLNNLDLAYDYINIYYTRSTGDADQSIIKTYKITDKFKITNRDVEISITGYENHEEISLQDINIQYTNFDSAKTIVNCQNITFVGNPNNNYELFSILEKYSLFITPEVVYDDKGIGFLDYNYNENYKENGYEYSNAKNIYYKLGYWDEEIYRFGVVYVLPDYTLSPVFNIRGRKIIGNGESFTLFDIQNPINYSVDYLLENTINPLNPENAKGVFKIDCSEKLMFDGTSSIKPIGIGFNFTKDIVDGLGYMPGLKELTKGFFIVRQKRIPTILAQAVGIATSSKAKIPVLQGVNMSKGISHTHFAESFLTNRSGDLDPILGSKLFPITDVTKNALLCPEASLRTTLFNSFFNSSEYTLKEFKYKPSSPNFISYDNLYNYTLRDMIEHDPGVELKAELTLIEPGIELIRNSKFDFCSKAGDSLIAHKHLDPVLGNYEDLENTQSENSWNNGTTKVRGEFNTFIGTNIDNILHAQYYNIFEKNYNFEELWKEYFRVRYNDGSPYSPVSDRIEWKNLNEKDENYYSSNNFFRGDCYINTFSHRMHWNFIDPEMPTNKKIVNPYTWATNFKIKNRATIRLDNSGSPISTNLTYNKLLDLFTYKDMFIPEYLSEDPTESGDDVVLTGILEPQDKKFKKYSEINGIFGAEKINRPDVNAVPLGHWATFKICSNVNLAMRDVDFSRPMEEAIHKQKRGFFPLQSMNPSNSLPESNVINNGISKSTNDKYYYEVPDVPFIKTDFSNRIYYSELLLKSVFTNGNRIFKSINFQDYSKEYGAIVKLVEWYGHLVVVLEHGVILIPVNERAVAANASGENVYINTAKVLPENPKVLSNMYGSLWPESIVKTSRFIYGIDTVGKKIWRTNGETFENISDIKIQKFLNDKIKLRESDKDRTVNINFIKSHYNAFKNDVMFVFKYNDVVWNLCWNELTQKWVTQYTWFPEFSENINNIFYTFANQEIHSLAGNQLYKHGFAGLEDESNEILSSFWYDEQHPFEFEFIVTEIPGIQKIFNNLRIISNKAEPNSFYYEVVGESFDWTKYKQLISKLNNTELTIVDGVSMSGIGLEKNETNVQLRYERYLQNTPTLYKLPYIYMQSFDINNPDSFYRVRPAVTPPINMSVLRDLTIRENNKTKELLINSYQKGADKKVFGIMKGNMQYLEDAWNIQVQPIVFKYAYIVNDVLTFSKNIEMPIRDKYLKVRIQYSGTEYAIINAIKSIFTISYA